MHGLSPNPMEFDDCDDSLRLEKYFERLGGLVPKLPYQDMGRIAEMMLRAFDGASTVFVFGNGGSAATASHVMCDMNKGAIDPGQVRRLKVMALTDNVPLMTAWANDSRYADIFSEQLKNFVQPDDMALAISTSGRSPNVLRALRTAREAGAVTAGLAGFDGGEMRDLCDVCAIVPSDDVRLIEDMHHAMAHSIAALVADKIRARNREWLAAAGVLEK